MQIRDGLRAFLPRQVHPANVLFQLRFESIERREVADGNRGEELVVDLHTVALERTLELPELFNRALPAFACDEHPASILRPHDKGVHEAQSKNGVRDRK